MSTVFKDHQDDALRRVGLLNNQDARNYIERKIRDIDQNLWWAHAWHDRRKTAFVNTVAPYDTGTVTVTNGSKTVTGSGTTFPTGAADRKFALSLDDPYYEIDTRDSATQLTLKRAYVESTASAQSYVVYNDILELADMDALVADEMIPMKDGYDYPLTDATSQSWSNLGHMPRSKSTPTMFRLIEDTYDGTARIQVWPVPDAAIAIRYVYLKPLEPMDTDDAESSNPEERRDLITIGATAEAYHYIDDVASAMQYEQLFEAKLRKAIAREKRLHTRTAVLRSMTMPAVRPSRAGRFTWRA